MAKVIERTPQVITANALWGWRHTGDRRVTAVFVHGLFGSHESWRAQSSQMDFLQLIHSDPGLSEYDCLYFEYQTTKWRGSPIEECATRLSQCIANFVDENRSDGYDSDLVLIAHSMGGLVCMKYIVDCLSKNQQPPIRGLLLYGTPSTGAELIAQAEEAIGFLGSSALGVPGMKWLASKVSDYHAQIRDLKVASRFLVDLQEQWALRVINGGDEEAGDAGRMWLPVHVVAGQGDWAVPKHSARGLYGAISSSSLQCNHRELVKPASIRDERYQVAKRFLQLCAASKRPNVLSRIWHLSQSIWACRTSQLISEQKASVDLFPSNVYVDSKLAKLGFSGCRVDWSYRTLVTADEITIGAAFIPLTRQDIPYVHAVDLSALDKKARQVVSKALTELFSSKDREDIWNILFGSFQLEIGGDVVNGVSVGPDTATTQLYVWKVFEVPEPMRNCECSIRIRYEAVVPSSLNSFSFYVRERDIVDGYECTITVYGDPEFMVSNVALVPGQEVKVATNELPDVARSVTFRIQDVVVPKSRFSVRWGRRRNVG